MIRILGSLFACICVSQSCMAWNGEGHMVVAQIAYNHLTPGVKTVCDTLIATPVIYASSGNNTFVTAAVWADDIKSYTSAFSTWHYIDIPFSLDGYPTNSFTPPSFDVVKAIRTNIAVLQNPSETQSNRAFHLRLLLHFVGDIQQPLHCTTAISSNRTGGDAGGNSFSINGDWSNLHSLWDSGGGFLSDSLPRPLSVASQNTLNSRVAAIEASHPYDYTTNLGVIPDPMTWAQEGLGLAQTVSYVGIALNATPSSDYLDAAQTTTDKRMADGGHRLADLLNTLFTPPSVMLTSMTVTNGDFRFSWGAVSGATYQVQCKQQFSDLTWSNLADITPTTSTGTFSEPVTQSQRFYRVVQ